MIRKKLKRKDKKGASGGSKYAIKHELQRKGIYSPRSPFTLIKEGK